jgi:hypothetical protein
MGLSTIRETTNCLGHLIVSQHFMEPEGYTEFTRGLHLFLS